MRVVADVRKGKPKFLEFWADLFSHGQKLADVLTWNEV